MAIETVVPEKGATIGGYTVLRTEPVEHMRGTYIELAHQRTGARHLHVACPDDNNAFAVAFPTVPQDSTGVAHILEHVALAGSERYPVRDPFFSMAHRSLSTFMNAFTASDVTMYPFSSRVPKDYLNLLNIYLDAAFFPRLEERAFKQEGHRLEFEQLDDPTSGLRHKGVVYNEMKGATADPGSALGYGVGKALFPHLTYANNSGGDPSRIVDLTWEQLKHFHAMHYHPSNSHFFTVGDIALPRILEVIERQVLNQFERLDVDFTIGDEPVFAAPTVHTEACAVAKTEDPRRKGQALVAWATVQANDPYETFKMSLLSDVLMGNPGAPLHKALIDSSLGDDIADHSAFDPGFKQAVYGAGLKGIDPADAEKVQDLVMATLEGLARDGLSADLVDATLHQLEIAQREVSNAGFPYSLRVCLQLTLGEMYGGDPFRGLRFDQDLERFQEERKDRPVLEEMIRRQLLENPHRALIVLSPDPEFETRREAAELANLAAIEASLADGERLAIVEDAKRLKDSQEGEEDKSVLPDLALSDIPMSFVDPETRVASAGPLDIHLFPQPTNGFVYFDVQADFSSLPDDLKDYLALFAYALPRSGAAGQDFVTVARRLEAFTGGISAAAAVRSHADGNRFSQNLRIGGKALTRNSRDYVALLRDLTGAVTFERARVRDIIAEFRTQFESSVQAAGTQYAVALAAASLGPEGALSERLGGLTQLALLKRLGEQDDAQLGDTIRRLEQIRDSLFAPARVRFCVTSEEKSLADLEALAAELAATMSGADANGAGPGAMLERKHRARTLPLPVAYNALVRNTVPYVHPDAPALLVLGGLLQEGFIHREVREKGGAYGGRAGANPGAGNFVFGSYRDPHVAATYKLFDEAVRHVIGSSHDDQLIKNAILTACRAVDPLESPDTRGRRRFSDDLHGFTLAQRERFKRGLLAVTGTDLQRAAETYLAGVEGVMATIASPEKVEEANREMGGVFQVEAI